MAALEAASAVGLVVTAEAAAIQAAVGTLRALRPWLDRTWIILNQVSPGAHLSTGAVERTLRRPLLGSVPFDTDQARGLAQGEPAVLHRPTSPLARARGIGAVTGAEHGGRSGRPVVLVDCRSPCALDGC